MDWRRRRIHRLAGEQVAEHGHCALAVFPDGSEVGPDVEEGPGAGALSPAAADLLLELDHPYIAFGLVVVEWKGEISGEPEHVSEVGLEPGQ